MSDSTSLQMANSSSPTTMRGTGVTLIQFHGFPKLPPEIRLQIWGLTIRPRIVKVSPARDPQRSNVFLNAIPAILRVNSEARAEGMKHYELSSQYVKVKREVIQLGGYIRVPPNSFYFNCENDVLYIPDAKLLPLFGTHEYNWCNILRKIQKLAIARHTITEIRPIRRYPTPVIWSNSMVPCWPALREVYATCEDILYPTSHNSEHLNEIVDIDGFKARLVEETDRELSWIEDKRVALKRDASALRAKLESVYALQGPMTTTPKVQGMLIIPDLPLVPQ